MIRARVWLWSREHCIGVDLQVSGSATVLYLQPTRLSSIADALSLTSPVYGAPSFHTVVWCGGVVDASLAAELVCRQR